MAKFRSFNEIVNSMIERLKLTQPNLNTNPGTVARDLFIDLQADQIERLNSALTLISQKQNPESASGSDLDKWASNYGIIRKTGVSSNGTVVFTTNVLNSDISIPAGTIVSSKSGVNFKTIGSYSMSTSEKNRYSATANRLRSALNSAGITDNYALEVPVQAIRPGISGNIASLQIVSSNVADSINVINLTSFKGGSNVESDSSFKNRIFAKFSGSSSGTSSAYRSASISIDGVADALVVEPGNVLMLRDGTETIETDDGSFRILNSGTGGKIDIYILGKQLEEISESYIFNDLSGIGDFTDERNDFVVGQNLLDKNLTSEERRVLAFQTGNIPLQPVDSIVSISGTSSGVLLQRAVDSDGVISGQYELLKDTNADTGGSPFGFDKIHFISSEKSVSGELLTKQDLNSSDPLKFYGVTDISYVYQNVSAIGENSYVLSTDRSTIVLSHKPVVSVSRVLNKTTGEVYVITSQNIDEKSGLNLTGKIKISGRSLPSISDVLSVDYIWRMEYNSNFDFNNKSAPFGYKTDLTDSIDWSVQNGIVLEKSKITKSIDDLEYQVLTSNIITSVKSVYFATETTSTLTTVLNNDGENVSGIELSVSDDVIINIISIIDENNVEIYKTYNNDGYFYSKTIVLPSDSPATFGNVYIKYNKVELYNVSNSDAGFSDDIVSLPSESILDSLDLLADVEAAYIAESDVYIDYSASISKILPTTSLSSLPASGDTENNTLFDASLSEIVDSYQPVFYSVDSLSSYSYISKYNPTRLNITTTGTSKSGKIRVSGSTIEQIELQVFAGNVYSNLEISLLSSLKDYYGVQNLPTTLSIAKVNSIKDESNNDIFALSGVEMFDSEFSLRVSKENSSISKTSFKLSSTSLNQSKTFNSGDILKINIFVKNTDDFEDIYFSGNNSFTTNKIFYRINKISVISGFRTSNNNLVGNITVLPFSQPQNGTSYYSNYSFTSPKEGERLTIKYNLNKLITYVTNAVESVRVITADVLVKESPSLSVDVTAEIIVNDNFTQSSSTVSENVANSIANLLNSGSLGSTIDYSDIISVGSSISGVDSINVSQFNKSGTAGRRTFIKALDNQSISAGTIIVNVVKRQDFRIS